jgi:hypothetical protein
MTPDRLTNSYAARFAQLAALWGLSVSQPVFSMLTENPEFLVVRGSTMAEVGLFAVGLTMLPPAMVVAFEWAVGRVSAAVECVLHQLCIGLFCVPIAMISFKQAASSAVLVLAVSTVVAACVAVAYARWRAVRLFITFGILLPLLGLASFLLDVDLATENAQAARVSVSREAPIVMVVLDELPSSSIMTRTGEIDATRFPNFGRLAASSTWYPRATTVHEHTTGAVPAILTGRLPQLGQVPSLEDHPENLFTLLGEHFRLRVHEDVTYLCPRRYCPRPKVPLGERISGLISDVEVAYLHLLLPSALAGGLPDIDSRWSGFRNTDRLLVANSSKDVNLVVRNRAEDVLIGPRNRTELLLQPLASFLGGIDRSGSTATLHFLHLQLPHIPWRFLRSGKTYDGDIVDGLVEGEIWGREQWPVLQTYQRHLLQVQFTDTVLGQILDRLERSELYDKALVVVVADHGVSVRNGRARRFVTPGNFADIARIPLFVKLPGQRRGSVDRRPVNTTSLLPTISDVVGVRIPWRVDGASLLGPLTTPSEVEVATREERPVRMSVRSVDRQQVEALKWKAQHFGEGHASLFALGVHKGLLGRHAGTLRVAAGRRKVELDDMQAFANVDLSARFIPARVTGKLDRTLEGDIELALALNDRIVALTRPLGPEGLRFAAMVPEASFRSGKNDVDVYVVRGAPGSPRLIRLIESVVDD